MSPGVTRSELLIGAGAGAAGLGLGTAGIVALGYAVDTQDPIVDGGEIPVAGVSTVPATEPDSSAWDAAQRVRVALLPQQVAPPSLDKAVVDELIVSAVQDGQWLGLLLQWKDPSVNDLDGVRRYHDAVAVQIPAKAGTTPAITMGAPSTPVHILQWRATWQRDIDSPERTGVDQIYPNVVHDVMPDDILPPETAAYYWVGRKAGNPLSQVKRTSPVEEVVAEGFGSTTHIPTAQATGRGIHDGEGWKVSVAVPLQRATGDALTAASVWPVAFAVWRGDAENRGSRKHYAPWLNLRFSGGGA